MRQPHDADGEGHAGQQHEALGHHADETGDGADDRVLPALVAAQELAAGQQQADRDDQVADPLDDPVDVVAQRRVDQREAAGLLGQLRRVVLGADLRHHHAARCRRRQRCRSATSSPSSFTTGSASPVSSDSSISRFSCVKHHAVGDDLRAGAQLDDVVEHQLVRLQFDDLAVAHDVRARRVDDAQLVEHLLGAQLLDDADHAVGDDDAAEQRILRRAGERSPARPGSRR